jgi:pyruvate dehydrogenase E2 component (dihydrolipoamide acetyltransferase)
MPSLGADMEAGTVLRWYVKPGDAVHRGDLMALVDTSKAEIASRSSRTASSTGCW